MAKAKRDGGLYYVGDAAVDANGVAVKDAPKRLKDTDPSKQPGALGALTPEERMGVAIASALKGDIKAPAREKPADADTDADTDPGDEIDATDAARELAEENEVSLADVKGTGANGRITVEDVREYIRA